MIETGRVKDPNYVLDEKGKAHFLFSTKNKKTGETEKTFRTHTKHGSASRKKTSSQTTSKSTPAKKKRKTGKRRGFASDDEDEEEDFDYDDSGSYILKSWNTTKRTRAQSLSSKGPRNHENEMEGIDDDNPLPGFIDPITLEAVVKPAISPYGHVMGYDTFIFCYFKYKLFYTS